MDLRKLKTLIDLVQNSGISELEISEGEEKIRIAKQFAAPATTTVNIPHRRRCRHRSPWRQRRLLPRRPFPPSSTAMS